MLKALVCNLVKHLVKGLGSFVGGRLAGPVNENSSDNIDRWIQTRPRPDVTVGPIRVSMHANVR